MTRFAGSIGRQSPVITWPSYCCKSGSSACATGSTWTVNVSGQMARTLSSNSRCRSIRSSKPLPSDPDHQHYALGVRPLSCGVSCSCNHAAVAVSTDGSSEISLIRPVTTQVVEPSRLGCAGRNRRSCMETRDCSTSTEIRAGWGAGCDSRTTSCVMPLVSASLSFPTGLLRPAHGHALPAFLPSSIYVWQVRVWEPGDYLVH